MTPCMKSPIAPFTAPTVAAVPQRILLPLVLLVILCGASQALADPPTERLYLVIDSKDHPQEIDTGLMRPFEVLLIAERDADSPQISTVVFTLDVPEGLLLVGEEILTESLIALGTPRKGINLSFHCVEVASVEVMRFRFLATQPLQGAEISLSPDSRTNFRGIVSCKDENYDKWDTAPSSVRVSTK